MTKNEILAFIIMSQTKFVTMSKPEKLMVIDEYSQNFDWLLGQLNKEEQQTTKQTRKGKKTNVIA